MDGRDLARSASGLGWDVSVNQAGPLIEQMLELGRVEMEKVDPVQEPVRLPFIVYWTITHPDHQGDHSSAAGSSLFEAALQAVVGLGLSKPKK